MTSEARNNRLPIPRPAVGNDRMFPALFSRIALEAIRAGGEDMPLFFRQALKRCQHPEPVCKSGFYRIWRLHQSGRPSFCWPKDPKKLRGNTCGKAASRLP